MSTDRAIVLDRTLRAIDAEITRLFNARDHLPSIESPVPREYGRARLHVVDAPREHGCAGQLKARLDVLDQDRLSTYQELFATVPTSQRGAARMLRRLALAIEGSEDEGWCENLTAIAAALRKGAPPPWILLHLRCIVGACEFNNSALADEIGIILAGLAAPRLVAA